MNWDRGRGRPIGTESSLIVLRIVLAEAPSNAMARIDIDAAPRCLDRFAGPVHVATKVPC